MGRTNPPVSPHAEREVGQLRRLAGRTLGGQLWSVDHRVLEALVRGVFPPFWCVGALVGHCFL
jgi:hypothetical protein